MTQIDLNYIGTDLFQRKKAIKWLLENYGPISEGRWKIDRNLTYINFANEKHATFFILKWSQ
jgi:hypothetical protein